MRARPAGVALLFASLLAPTAGAVDYLGEFCWQRQPEGNLVRLGVTHVGDGHLQLTGWADTSSPGVTPLTGSAQVSGGSVYMSLSYAGENAELLWSGTARVVLDRQTLAGTVELLELVHQRSDPDPFRARAVRQPAAPFEPTPCP